MISINLTQFTDMLKGMQGGQRILWVEETVLYQVTKRKTLLNSKNFKGTH